jgi:hypothetical protein
MTRIKIIHNCDTKRTFDRFTWESLSPGKELLIYCPKCEEYRDKSEFKVISTKKG